MAAALPSLPGVGGFPSPSLNTEDFEPAVQPRRLRQYSQNGFKDGWPAARPGEELPQSCKSVEPPMGHTEPLDAMVSIVNQGNPDAQTGSVWDVAPASSVRF